ncbi:metal ABC transporter substrate-binding protein [Mucisphaera sp.]|uniref:metal ABC transporter substrate-binding protein n=1 Tax=Mucisphaera sp. TaxID=2913024 RepID=UPI003D118B01
MTTHRNTVRYLIATILAVSLLTLTGCSSEDTSGTATTINICVTATDAAELVKAVGGNQISLTTFVRGGDDPHIVNATPAMITALANADLLVVVGLALEEAYLPSMLAQAGNDNVMPGQPGHLDLSVNMRTIVGPEGRGVPGSFHPEDNPHYLADPVEGVKAAKAIAEKLSEIRPDLASEFNANAEAFANSIIVAMVGEHVAEHTDPANFEELAIAIETNDFTNFPHLQEDPSLLAGWLGALRPYTDIPFVGDHDLWPYFARRYGIRAINYLEPEPGVPPTAPHLQQVILDMREADARIILSIVYFDPQHAAFVANAVDGIAAPMAHQPGGRPGVETYLDFVNYNAQQLLTAIQTKVGDPPVQQ